jgi:hypothetical protein
LVDLFPMTVSGLSIAKDWAEISGGVRYGAWKGGAITTSLTASVVPDQTTAYVSRVGISQSF